MWYFLFFGMVIIASLVVSVIITEESQDNGSGVLCCILLGISMLLAAFLGYRAYPGGSLAGLNDNGMARYTVQAKYETAGAVILYLDTSNGFSGWYYKVLCDNLAGGCPKEWPKHFIVKKDEANPATEKLVIVPVTEDGKTEK